MAKAGPINRPEIAPFDFTAQAFPDIAVAVVVPHLHATGDGPARRGRQVRPVSPFSDATKPFKLEN